mgnify:CR=1 FL=1
MKKNIFLSGVAAIALCAACQSPKPAETVHLKGQLIDMGTNPVTMSYNGAASMLGDSRNILFHTDENGYFDTIISLKEPTYFNISRNTLYLTPGDDMTVYITTNNQEANFQGVGAQANNYMKYRLFPKGGSYLKGGRNIRGDFEETKALVDSLAEIRRNELSQLDSVSEEFKMLESARIQADVLNSYFSYVSYANIYSREDSRETMQQKYNDFMQKAAPYAKAIYPSLMDEKLLNVAVVRDVLHNLFDKENVSWTEGLDIPARTRELYEAYNYISLLRRQADKATVDSVETFAASMQQPDFANELKLKVEQVARLLPGKPAFDIKMTDIEGNTHRLSEFKGKVLYLDFWATWCGPCIQQSPHFEALSKEYAGKDILFIPISQDTNLKAWKDFLGAHKKELPQYNSVDNNAHTNWQIFYIPRFVVIDKDFNIVNAYAPVPSDKEAIKAILDPLTEK